MIEMGKILFCALVRAMVQGICRLYKAFRKSKRAKIGTAIVTNLAFTPYMLPALTSIAVVGTALFVLVLPFINFAEV